MEKIINLLSGPIGVPVIVVFVATFFLVWDLIREWRKKRIKETVFDVHEHFNKFICVTDTDIVKKMLKLNKKDFKKMAIMYQNFYGRPLPIVLINELRYEDYLKIKNKFGFK